jgi:20S proteasome alpha/beta subunit
MYTEGLDKFCEESDNAGGPNPPQHGRKKRMTLIAAFRTDKGAVICADSKESDGYFYVRVDKIDRLDLNAYWAVIGGSGYYGDLIDGLTDVLEQSIEGWAAGLTESAIKNNLSFIFKQYYADEVKNFEAKRKEKRMEFVICIQDKNSKEVFLWKANGQLLKRIKTFALIGARTLLYEYEVTRLYGTKGKPWTTRAVALGVHLLALVKATCDWVGGPTKVVIANETGMQRYEPEDVDVLEERARKFSEALAELTLALPDVSTSEGSFIEILGGFEENVLALRGYYLRRLAQSLAQQIGTGMTAIRAELPMPSAIPLGNGITVHNKPGLVGLSFGVTRAPQSDSQEPEDKD